MVRHAACACGSLRVACEGDPLKISLCHCRACQRRTGAPFGVAVFFPRAAVTARGETRAYVRQGDSGHPLTFHFCPTCGATVWWEPARAPDRVAVALGAFADPSFPPPGQAVYEAEAHPWTLGLGRPA